MIGLLSRRTFIKSFSAIAATLAMPRALLASGTEHIVQMLNKHPEDKKKKMVFYPHILQVNSGDTVTFESVDKGHNSASIKGMIPEGAEAWKGKINKDVTVTFDQPGFYGYVCTPHGTNGMVGLVVVEGDGKLNNLEAAQKVKQRGKSKKAFKEIWKEAEEMGLLS